MAYRMLRRNFVSYLIPGLLSDIDLAYLPT